MTETITDEQIEALKTEASAAGDLTQVAICQVALGFDGEKFHVGEHVWAELQALDMTADEARAQCAQVISDAAAAATTTSD